MNETQQIITLKAGAQKRPINRTINLNTIDQYKSIADFLEFIESRATKASYKSALKEFFTFLNTTPDAYITEDIRLLEKSAKIKSLDKYSKDILRFFMHIKISKSPHTVTGYVSTIKVFLRSQNIEIEGKIWDQIKHTKPKNRAITKEKPLTPEEIAKILDKGETLEKALFLCLASSGMRVGELLQVTLDDVDTTRSPTKINVIYDLSMGRTVKDRDSRTVFISDEATNYLKTWLEVRDAHMKRAIARTHIKTWHGEVTKKLEDPRVFPYGATTVRFMWDSMCKKAGLYETDDRTHYNVRHIHCLRKFFKTYFSRMEESQAREITSRLLGHDEYLDANYLQFTEEQLAQYYLKGMKHVTIYDRPIENKEIFEKQQSEINDLRKLVDQMMKTIDIDLDQQITQERALDEEQRPTHISTITRKDGTTFQVDTPL